MNDVKIVESQGTRLLQQLAKDGKYLFDKQEAALAASLEKIPPTQLNKILFNLAKQKRIVRLRRGLYYSSLGFLPLAPHPFVISNHLIQPSAVSHWSALQHHGFTEQVPMVVTASTPNKIITPSMRAKKTSPSSKKHAWEIEGTRYEYVHIQQPSFFGFEKIWINENFQVSMTDRERTLLDVFISPNMFGGMGEALGILENALPHINIQKFIKYVIRYGKKSTAKRLGWSLEYFGISKKLLTPLLKVPMNYFCRLDPTKPAIGGCDKRWMIQNNLNRIKNK